MMNIKKVLSLLIGTVTLLCVGSSAFAQNVSQAYLQQANFMPKAYYQTLPEVGMYMGGGVVFYVDKDNKKALIAAVKDSAGGQWSTNTATAVGATNTDLFGGAENTAKMLKCSGCMAELAAAYGATATGGGYTDWYVPALDELLEMGIKQRIINYTALKHNGTALVNTNSYWSSTETAGVAAGSSADAAGMGNFNLNAFAPVGYGAADKTGVTVTRFVRIYTYS